MLKVKEQKHLGLKLDSKLSFERHVNEKIIKANKGIGIINLTDHSKLYEELGWETLSDRRWCRRILQILKIESTRTLLNLEINYLHTVDPCIDLITLIPFKK